MTAPDDAYSVDPSALRDVAASLNGQADAAGRLSDTARRADVPSASWGLLGHELGLYELYAEVRDQADAGLARIHEFLAWAAQNLTETAGDYEEHEQSIVSTFARIDERGSGGEVAS